MTDFANCSFTAADGTALGSYVGEDGNAWTLQNGYSVAGSILSNIFVPNGSTAYQNGGTPPSADYYVQCDLIMPVSAGGALGPAMRMATGANTFITFRAAPPSTAAILRFLAGSAVTLNSTTYTLSAGSTYTFRLEGVGPAFTCYVNGSSILTATDSNITAAGHVGFRAFTTNCNIDNFRAGSIGGTTLLDYCRALCSASSRALVGTVIADKASSQVGASSSVLAGIRLYDASAANAAASGAATSMIGLMDRAIARTAATARGLDEVTVLDVTGAAVGAGGGAVSGIQISDLSMGVLWANVKTVDGLQIAAVVDYSTATVGASSRLQDRVIIADVARARAGASSASTSVILITDRAMAVIGAYAASLDALRTAPVTEQQLVRAIVRAFGDGVITVTCGDGVLSKMMGDGIDKRAGI